MLTNKTLHPIIIKRPPIGVIGPKTGLIEFSPIWLNQHKRKIEIEKKQVPKITMREPYLNPLDLKLCFSDSKAKRPRPLYIK